MKAEITITRNSRDKICIRIMDVLSGSEFVEVSMSAAEFALAVTGLSGQEADMEVRNLQNVGKKRMREQRSMECPLTTYNKETLAQWLEQNAQEDGWHLNTYLGSQSSVSYKDGKTILNYTVTKYINTEE